LIICKLTNKANIHIFTGFFVKNMLFFMHKMREKLTKISSHALTPLCFDKRTLSPAPSLKSKGRGEYVMTYRL
jgi:hypothetical protein